MKTLLYYIIFSCFSLQIIASQDDFVVIPSTTTQEHLPATEQPTNPIKTVFNSLLKSSKNFSNNFTKKLPKPTKNAYSSTTDIYTQDFAYLNLEKELKSTQEKLQCAQDQLHRTQQELQYSQSTQEKLQCAQDQLHRTQQELQYSQQQLKSAKKLNTAKISLVAHVAFICGLLLT